MNDSEINEIEYGDFSLGFHRRGGKKGLPLNSQIETTFRCNLKCVHCYIAEDSSKEELSFDEITGILDQLHREGCLWVCFTGGDPFMREDFPDIYAYAKRKGFLITIFTNGTLITPEIADYLSQEPPFSIEITLNGVTPATYERISRLPGSFRKALEGIGLIMEKNLPLKLKTKAMTLNYHELDKIREYVEGLGKKFSLDALIYPALDGSLRPCSFRLSPGQITGLDRFYEYEDEEDCRVHPGPNPPPSSVSPTPRGRGLGGGGDKLFRCAGGTGFSHISPYGELIFCTFMRKPNFDLRKGSFKKGFYTLMPGMRAAEYRSDSECKNCGIFQFCSRCPAVAKLENGDPEKPVEYLCELAHRYAEQAR